MKLSRPQIFLCLSVILLIVIGHVLAKNLSINKQTAWIYVTLFYGVWTLVTLALLLKKSYLTELFKPGHSNRWYLFPALLSIPVFFFIFIPNQHVLKPDIFLVLNIIICLLNPWLEELYWRGLVYEVFKEKPTFSFLLSALGFGLSHPLIFGVNSPGIAGVPGFAGAFLIGAIWWFCLRKTTSLRGAIATHFLIDVAGMAVYVLADKLVLMKLPDVPF